MLDAIALYLRYQSSRVISLRIVTTTHFMQTSYVLLNVLQISSMNLSYARMLMSFTKLSTSILIFNALHFSIKLALKNRKRIDEMKDS